MKKILILAGAALLLWSCASQSVTQETPRQTPAMEKPASQKPSGPGPVEAKFRGKTRDEVFEAIKTVLAERAFEIKSADLESGLITAVGKDPSGDESLAPRLTFLVFVDAKGIPNIQVESGEAGRAGREKAAEILAALRELLK